MPRLKTLRPRVAELRRAAPALTVLERPSSTRRGYSYRWQQYRKAWLQQHPLCGDRENGTSAEHSQCVAAGQATAATDVDHVQRVTSPNDPLFWEPTNHQSLCHSCHSVKTRAEEKATAGGGSVPS